MNSISKLAVLFVFLAGLLSSCGSGGGENISLSADPLANWHVRHYVARGNNLRGVAYGKETFVAVGDGGAILTSRDGITWTSSGPGITADLRRVRYGNGMFVAVGKGGTIFSSSDGLHWASQNSGTSAALYDVTYANGFFVAVGEGSAFRPLVLSSPDGLYWSQRAVQTSGTVQTLTGITHGNNTFVAVGVPGIILTSPDGMTWTERGDYNAMLNGVVYGNGRFVAAGTFMGKAAPAILASTDGVNWQHFGDSINSSTDLKDIAYGGGYFVGVGFLPDGSILTSGDGMKWTVKPLTAANEGFYGVAFGGGVFTAVGPDGTILQSDPIQ